MAEYKTSVNQITIKAHGAEAVNPEIPDDLDTSDDLLIAQVEQ